VRARVNRRGRQPRRDKEGRETNTKRIRSKVKIHDRAPDAGGEKKRECWPGPPCSKGGKIKQSFVKKGKGEGQGGEGKNGREWTLLSK